MNFTDFLIYDAASQAIYADPAGQRKCRACLTKLAETAERFPGRFLAEAARKDSRKGVAFKQKTLDDLEHSVFAQRLADRMPTKPAGGNYGDFLHQGILRQGEVLGDLQWGYFDIIRQALQLGGVDPEAITDPKTTPAQRHALVGKINWQNVTLPALKGKLGPSFKVDDAWKRAFAIAKLKRIKAAVETGQPITDPYERKLLGIWRTLEVQLGGEGDKPSQILPAGPKSDVGLTRMPMSHADRTRFYKTLTGTNENVEAPLQLSAQSAYHYLTQYGMEIVSDEEITDLYLNRILHDLKTGNAFIPSTARGSEADAKRWRDSAARSWGGFISAGRGYDPGNAPGVAQWLAGMTTRGHKMRTNRSGRRVPYAYNEPEEFERSGDVPGIKYVIDAPSSEVPDETINAFYKSRTPKGEDAFEKEMLKPARDAVNWLRNKGWIDDPTRVNDLVQDVVMAMMARTGSVPNWRTNTGYRRSTASMLARRFASQGWPSASKERTGHTSGGDDQPDLVQAATASNRSGGEDQFSRIQGGAAKARAVIQKAINSILDADTSAMHDDEEEFVNTLDSLNDPSRAIDALGTLDQLATRYERELPQVKRAVDRIHRHLDPLLRKVG